MQSWTRIAVEVTDPIGLALNFAAEQAMIKLVDYRTNIFKEFQRFRPIIRENSHEALWGGGRFIRFGIDRVVAQQRIFSEHRAGIDTKSVTAPPHPEAQYVCHRFPHFWIS